MTKSTHQKIQQKIKNNPKSPQTTHKTTKKAQNAIPTYPPKSPPKSNNKPFPMLVAPSILSSDFLRLGAEVESICKAGADFVHIDIMDGHFVPNLTFGAPVIKQVAKVATKPLDVHLMVENVDFFVDSFLPIKPEFISVHIEEVKHLHRLISHIRKNGIRPAIVLNPHTSEKGLEYILPDIDMALLMSVNPGFGGQEFIPSVLSKVQNLREMIESKNPKCLIEVDGGVNDKNALALQQAGVDIVVAGSFVFGASNYAEAIDSLKNPS